jgi:hypothetical protein
MKKRQRGKEEEGGKRERGRVEGRKEEKLSLFTDGIIEK